MSVVGNQPDKLPALRFEGWLITGDPALECTLVLRRGNTVWRYQMSPCGYLQPVDEHGNPIHPPAASNPPPPHIIDRLDRAWRKTNGDNPHE